MCLNHWIVTTITANICIFAAINVSLKRAQDIFLQFLHVYFRYAALFACLLAKKKCINGEKRIMHFAFISYVGTVIRYAKTSYLNLFF